MQINFILSLIFATLIAIFALKNGNKVLIDFLFAKVNISQAIVIFVSAILGAVIVAILGSVRSFKMKKDLKELNKKLSLAEEENKNLLTLLESREEENTKSIEESIEDLEAQSKNEDSVYSIDNMR